MTTNIRPMIKKDKPALMRILKTTPEFKPSEVVVAEELIDAYLEDPNSGYYHLIAETDPSTSLPSPTFRTGKVGSVISGYICYGLIPLTEGSWDIYWMAVAREKRGQGIGGALLKQTEAKIIGAEGRLVFIETSSIPSYENTRRFYLGQGYKEIVLIPDFYEPGDGKVIFQKRV